MQKAGMGATRSMLRLMKAIWWAHMYRMFVLVPFLLSTLTKDTYAYITDKKDVECKDEIQPYSFGVPGKIFYSLGVPGKMSGTRNL